MMNRTEVALAWRGFLNGWKTTPEARARTLAELRSIVDSPHAKPSLKRAALKALAASEGRPERPPAGWRAHRGPLPPRARGQFGRG